MKKFLLMLPILVLSQLSNAAEDFTLWADQTFTAPFTDGKIATSSTISNNGGLNSVKVDVIYAAGDPLPCDCKIKAVIEEEIAAGVWVPIADQFQAINTSLGAPSRVIVLSPLFNSNPGVPIFQDIGEGVQVSHTTGVSPDKFRLVIYLENFNGGVGLNSITLSAYGRKYDS